MCLEKTPQNNYFSWASWLKSLVSAIILLLLLSITSLLVFYIPMLVLLFILYWHIDILEKTRDFAPNIWKLSHSTLPFLGLPNPSPSPSQFLCPCMKFSSFFPASVLCRLYIPGEASGAESIISMLHATTTQWSIKNMSTTTQIWVIITQSKDLFKGLCIRSSLITATSFLELVRLISEMRDITKHFLLYNSYELHQTASK